VPRDGEHGREDGAIFNAAAAQLLFNHFRALRREVVALRHA